jgi:hypothetical protein
MSEEEEEEDDDDDDDGEEGEDRISARNGGSGERTRVTVKKTRFHSLIEENGVVLMPGCYDALSAAIIENEGFHAGFISGYALSASLLGKPDFGFLTYVAAISFRFFFFQFADAILNLADLIRLYCFVRCPRRSLSHSFYTDLDFCGRSFFLCVCLPFVILHLAFNPYSLI